jgi:hypothetical protein
MDIGGHKGIVVKIVKPENPTVEDHGTIYVWQSEKFEYGSDNCEHYVFHNWEKFLTVITPSAVGAPVWLPIETAPKDGTEILCKDDLYRHPWYYIALWNGIEWYHGWGDAVPRGNPSHWSPIPK